MSPRTWHDPSDVLADDHPLWKLHGAELVAPEAPDDRRQPSYRLQLVGARQLASSGWKDFQLALVDEARSVEATLIEGIYSVGGKGIAPWFDVEYRPRFESPGAAEGHVDLRERHLEVPLFRLLRALVPAHGHLAIAYETPVHRRTQLELMAGVPPVATELGWSAWRAGFDGGYKDWHISEGGHEGPKKLQCDVALNPEHARRVAARALRACREFGGRRPGGSDARDPDGFPSFWATVARRLESVTAQLERAV